MEVIGKPGIEVEDYPAFGHIQSELTESAIIDFPAVMLLFEVAVAKLFDGFPDGHFLHGEFFISEGCGLQSEPHIGKRHQRPVGDRLDLLDLAAVATSVECDRTRVDACL